MVLTRIVTKCNERVAMDSFADIITAFGGPARFAKAIGIRPNHAGVMKARNRVASEYWGKIVDANAARQIEGVSYATLAQIAARRKAADA